MDEEWNIDQIIIYKSKNNISKMSTTSNNNQIKQQHFKNVDSKLNTIPNPNIKHQNYITNL